MLKTVPIFRVKHANKFVCSSRSFKTEIYLCEMTQTLCSACLPENASSDSISFFFVRSFVAKQSSMMLSVGLPACLLKITQQFLKHFFSVYVIGLTIVIIFSLGRRTSPVQLLFLYALFQSMMGQSMTIFLNRPAYSSSTTSSTNVVFLQPVWPQIIAKLAYFGSSTENFFESSIFEIDLCILYSLAGVSDPSSAAM